MQRRTGTAGATVTAVLTLLFSTILAVPTSAASGPTTFDGEVTFENDSPAVNVMATLFEAKTPWDRGAYIGPAFTDSNGRYRYPMESGCYIVVVIAPLGAEFDSFGSGKVYDQQYGCVDDGQPVRSVLHRDAGSPPPPPKPPVTTAPPTTAPPTTAPPTTAPPKPPSSPVCWLWDASLDWVLVAAPEGATLPITEYRVYRESGELIRSIPAGEPYSTHVTAGNADGRYMVFPGVHLEQTGPLKKVSVTLVNENGESDPTRCYDEIWITPIGLDVDGSGSVERISGEFAFDFNADGETETVGEWFAPTEGILIDSSIEGPLTGEHLFGDQGGLYTDGYQKLATLDGNVDGMVAGTELTGLALWTDANSNAAVDPGEISTLADHGIVSISIGHTNYISSATLADGTTMVTEDLWFPVTSATGALGNRTVTIIVGLGIATTALGIALSAARRRRNDLDAELAQLLNQQTSH